MKITTEHMGFFGSQIHEALRRAAEMVTLTPSDRDGGGNGSGR